MVVFFEMNHIFVFGRLHSIAWLRKITPSVIIADICTLFLGHQTKLLQTKLLETSVPFSLDTRQNVPQETQSPLISGYCVNLSFCKPQLRHYGAEIEPL